MHLRTKGFSFAKWQIPHLWASDILTCPQNVYYLHLPWCVESVLSASSIYFLPLCLGVSHMCVVTGLCEACIKFWSQCKWDSIGTRPQKTKQEKAVMRAAGILTWSDDKNPTDLINLSPTESATATFLFFALIRNTEIYSKRRCFNPSWIFVSSKYLLHSCAVYISAQGDTHLKRMVV